MIQNSSIAFLLTRHGRNLTFTRPGTATYNARDAEVTREANTTYTVKGYFFNYKVEEKDYSTESMSDRRLVVNALDTSGNAIPKPFSGDTFAGQNETVTIKHTDEIVDGSTVLFYICKLEE